MRADRSQAKPRRRDEPSEAPATGSPSGSPEVVLALQRGAGNVAVTRLLARAPAQKSSVETPGHEEPGWVRPSTAPATDPVHVATIFFRTKEWTIDATDDALLKALADAYGPYAGRNIHKPQEPQGLRGRIVGYADPRRSSGPDNQKLSENRATWTWHHLLRHLVNASGVIPGHFDIERQGAGVAPEARGLVGDEPAAEGNVLAPFRKVEIFLAGQAVEAQGKPPKPTDPDDKRVKPPNLDDWNKQEWEKFSDWDKYDGSIESGNKREINFMARRIIGWAASGGSDIDDILHWTHTSAAVTGNDAIPKIDVKKPPWWDNRGADLAVATGRGGMTDRQKLVYKAKLAKRDMIETAKWSEMHFSSQGSSYVQLMEEAKKDNPDRAKIDNWVRDLAYLRFMIDATQNSAEALYDMTE
jgi:outer membrane protein OmpA-like peptidoglycan-associated protein